MTPEQLAQIAYEAYANTVSSGWRFAPWTYLSDETKDAWIAAAQAVKANVLSGFTKVGEGESI